MEKVQLTVAVFLIASVSFVMHSSFAAQSTFQKRHPSSCREDFVSRIPKLSNSKIPDSNEALTPDPKLNRELSRATEMIRGTEEDRQKALTIFRWTLSDLLVRRQDVQSASRVLKLVRSLAPDAWFAPAFEWYLAWVFDDKSEAPSLQSVLIDTAEELRDDSDLQIQWAFKMARARNRMAVKATKNESNIDGSVGGVAMASLLTDLEIHALRSSYLTEANRDRLELLIESHLLKDRFYVDSLSNLDPSGREQILQMDHLSYPGGISILNELEKSAHQGLSAVYVSQHMH